MLIEFDKYQPNTLRRNRVEALEKDLSDAFTIFSNRFNDPKGITMNDFLAFWNASQIKLLLHVGLPHPAARRRRGRRGVLPSHRQDTH
jgi:hypothetical protein